MSYRTDIEDLRPIFGKYGEIGDIYIPKDRFSRESRGFGFVRYILSFFKNLPKVLMAIVPL